MTFFAAISINIITINNPSILRIIGIGELTKILKRYRPAKLLHVNPSVVTPSMQLSKQFSIIASPQSLSYSEYRVEAGLYKMVTDMSQSETIVNLL